MKKIILVVDDSESIREVVRYNLESYGYSVILATDGEDALSFLDGREIHLVITDLHMPIRDGIGLIKKIRKIPKYKRIPILFLTTESQKEKKMEARKAGATAWILKPFVPEVLLFSVNRVIRRRF